MWRPKLTPKQQELVLQHREKVRKYVAREYATPRVPLNDQYRDGYLGLAIAATKYKPESGEFWNYAQWWVKNEVERGSMRLIHMVMVPNTYIQNYNAAKRFQIGDDLDMNAFSADRKTPILALKQQLQEAERVTWSLDEFESMKESIPATDNVLDEVIRREERDQLQAAIRHLSNTERSIVTQHAYRGLTLSEISEKRGKHRSWAEITYKTALDKLTLQLTG